MMELSFFVPGKPVSVNAMYGRRQTGGLYLKREAQVWKNAVAWMTHVHLTPGGAFKRPSIAYRFTGVRGDADNYVKLTQDAIALALRVNDKHFQIVSASVERKGEQGCWLQIMEADQPARKGKRGKALPEAKRKGVA